MYKFRQFYIPDRMMPGIRRYIDDKIRPGDFLQAVICNNLKKAVFLADIENLENLPAFVAYFHWNAPSECHGSEEKMKAWQRLKSTKPTANGS